MNFGSKNYQKNFVYLGKAWAMKSNEQDNYDDDLDSLRQENQLKRMKLRLEFGANFNLESENDDLPPEIESQFLDSVAQFERAQRQSNRVNIYDFLGQPDYRKSFEVPDNEITAELRQIIATLNRNQIELDTLCDVDERVLYEFITEELFKTETDDVRIEGMMHHFIYEEFHPNHKYDITNNCIWFFESFLDLESEYYITYLTKEAETNPWFSKFRAAFNSFQIDRFEITDLCFDEETAHVQFDTNFTCTIEGTNEIVQFSGSGKIELLYRYDYWCIQNISLPSQPE